MLTVAHPILVSSSGWMLVGSFLSWVLYKVARECPFIPRHIKWIVSSYPRRFGCSAPRHPTVPLESEAGGTKGSSFAVVGRWKTWPSHWMLGGHRALVRDSKRCTACFYLPKVPNTMDRRNRRFSPGCKCSG